MVSLITGEESGICLIEEPDNFNQCFEVIYGVASLYSDHEVIINASSGTRAMTMAASIVSFLTKNHLTYVTGKKEAGIIMPGTEQMKELALYAAHDRLKLQAAIELFNANHYGSALRQLSGITTLPEEQGIYYGIFSAYWYWDRLNYKKAFEYLSNVPDINEMIVENREFLETLLYLDSADDGNYSKTKRMTFRQKKYTYILLDLLNNATRRTEGEHYDDAVARLYRVVELLSQVLLLSYGIDDNEEKIRLSSLKPLLNRKKFSLYVRRADNKGILRIGLFGKFQLLEDLGLSGAGEWYQRLSGYLSMRNVSILAHGMTPASGEMAHAMLKEVNEVITESCRGIDLPLSTIGVAAQFARL